MIETILITIVCSVAITLLAVFAMGEYRETNTRHILEKEYELKNEITKIQMQYHALSTTNNVLETENKSLKKNIAELRSTIEEHERRFEEHIEKYMEQ